jgi:hypothetical protein
MFHKINFDVRHFIGINTLDEMLRRFTKIFLKTGDRESLRAVSGDQ